MQVRRYKIRANCFQRGWAQGKEVTQQLEVFYVGFRTIYCFLFIFLLILAIIN